MNEQILLVEDDEAIADALRLHLEQSGYRLHHESDGLAALSAVDRQRWDLILLDLMLPGADGWEVCRHVRQHHTGVPAIMLSARTAEAHSVEERIFWEWIQVGGVHRQLRVSGRWGSEVREPHVEVCFQAVVEHRDTSLPQPLRPADRPAHLLAL